MSKENQSNVLSGEVKGKIEDIKNVDGRLNTLNKNIISNDPIQKHLQSEEYISSTLEGLAGKIINEAVPNKDVQTLVDNLHANLAQDVNLLPSAADKLKFDIARVEAAVKGFVLPLNNGGPFDQLSLMDIEDIKEVFDNPIKATKEALIAVSGQAIPKEQYAQAVKDKAIDILKKDFNISPEQLKKYENFITQGDKNQEYDSRKQIFIPKANKLSEVEASALREVATNAVQKINDRLKKGKETGKILMNQYKLLESLGITDSNLKNNLLPAITKLPPEELQEKGSKIIKDFAPLLNSKNQSLIDGATKALTELDPKYLSEYSSVIANDLNKINEKGTSLWEKFKTIFTGKDYLGKRFEQSVNKYALLGEEYIKKEIDNKIFSNALTNDEIATGLTKFVNENQDKLRQDPKHSDLFLNVDEPAVIKAEQVNNINLNELRRVNSISFDEALFKNSKQFLPSEPTQQNTQRNADKSAPSKPNFSSRVIDDRNQSLKNENQRGH